MIVSFIGAVLSTVLIFVIGSATSGGLTPMRLTIAGAVMAALLHSLSSGVAIYYDLSQDLAFWYAGGVAGVKWEHLEILVPIILITIIFAIVLGRSISLISMGDDVATNLGSENEPNENTRDDYSSYSSRCFCFSCWFYWICRTSYPAHC